MLRSLCVCAGLSLSIFELAATVGASAADTHISSRLSTTDLYRALSKIAGETCTQPVTTGWSVAADGSGKVAFAPSKLVARLAAVGIKLEGTAAYHRCSGALQRDVGPALIAHLDCQKTVFTAMLNRLPLAGKLVTEIKGNRLTKPSARLDHVESVSSGKSDTAHTSSEVVSPILASPRFVLNLQGHEAIVQGNQIIGYPDVSINDRGVRNAIQNNVISMNEIAVWDLPKYPDNSSSIGRIDRIIKYLIDEWVNLGSQRALLSKNQKFDAALPFINLQLAEHSENWRADAELGRRLGYQPE